MFQQSFRDVQKGAVNVISRVFQGASWNLGVSGKIQDSFKSFSRVLFLCLKYVSKVLIMGFKDFYSIDRSVVR